MTAALRTLAFGEPEPAGLWGAGWMPGPGGEALLALGVGDADALVAGGPLLSAERDDREWRLDAAGAGLVAAPVGDPAAAQAPEDGIDGWMQLCRVSGEFNRDGASHAVDCLGLRGWWSGPLELGRYDSIRAVSTWFEPDEALALTAFRPRRAKAHDQDLLSGAVIAPEGAPPVEDSRLSTTYGAEGWPARAGLELWLAGEEPDRQYPRRASGAATGARAHVRDGGLELRAEPFRWHSRGRQGVGMYLLAQRS